MIELVVAITIVSLAAVAVLGAMGSITARTANAMVRHQAVAIGEAYLEEILAKPVTNPNPSLIETTRGTWDYIDQYNLLSDTGAHDQYGNPITALSNYNVKVVVSQSSALTGITASNARRVDITVTDPTGVQVYLSGYRANY